MSFLPDSHPGSNGLRTTESFNVPKCLGDGVLAVFRDENQENRVVTTGLEIFQELERERRLRLRFSDAEEHCNGCSSR